MCRYYAAMPKDRQVSALENTRRARGLSREGLAAEAGVSLRTVERIEGGDVTPHRATARVLAAVLGTTADVLFPDDQVVA